MTTHLQSRPDPSNTVIQTSSNDLGVGTKNDSEISNFFDTFLEISPQTEETGTLAWRFGASEEKHLRKRIQYYEGLSHSRFLILFFPKIPDNEQFYWDDECLKNRRMTFSGKPDPEIQGPVP